MKTAPTHSNRPLRTDTTVEDAGHAVRARAYMLRLSEERSSAPRWQRAAELLLAEADIGAFSNQVQLALFYARKLDLTA